MIAADLLLTRENFSLKNFNFDKKKKKSTSPAEVLYSLIPADAKVIDGFVICPDFSFYKIMQLFQSEDLS